MSVDTEELRSGNRSLTELFYRWYHVPALALVMLFMFWTRIQNYEAYLGADSLRLQAIDSWYHWRTTVWTVEQFPWLPGFDPWSGFPDGAFAAQFGTVFDFFVATVAMIIGLGDPSQGDIQLAALFSVPVLAVLVVLPVYALGKRIGGRAGGIAGVVFLALAPGSFMQRTTIGMFDHPAAEVLMMALSVIAIVLALRVVEQEPPAWELITAREWEALRRPAVYSALVGVVLTVYIWTWPPAVVLLGIFGAYLIVQLTLDFVRGRSPDHIAFVGIVSMLVVAVLTVTRIQEPSFSATSLGYLHPTLAILIAGGTAFIAWLARQWEQWEYDRIWYPVAIGASVLVGLGIMSVLLPSLYNTLVGNLTGRIIPFGYSPGTLTIREAQPPSNPAQFMFDQYGLAFYTGVVAVVLLAIRPFFGLKQRPLHLFVVVWSLFLISMGLTQIRFNYYLVIAIAVLNAHLVGLAIRWIDLSGGIDAIQEIETYQVLTLGVIAMLLVVPLFPPIAQASAVQVGSQTAPSDDATAWEPANDWLANNTPEVGEYGGATNGDEIAYYGDFERPAEGNFEYPEGAYGVMSWWDYGHLITVQGERMPHANPFQQNAQSASAFLTAQDEQQAERYLDAIAAGASPTHESDPEDLATAIEQEGTDEEIQYVMIDEKMAAGKFSAITQWTGPEYQTYTDRETITFQQQNGETVERSLRVTNENYQDTMLASLYLQDAQGLEHYRLVNETDSYSLVGFQLAQVPGSEQVFGQQRSVDYGAYDPNLAQNITAARQNNIGIGGSFYQPYLVSEVKTFERVAGATIEGQTEATPNATVTLSVELATNTDRTFTYTQTIEPDELNPDGSFAMTVPYPTEETLGPEDGYADSSVTAVSDYTIQAAGEGGFEAAEGVTVSEEAVQNGETIQVDLESVSGN